MNSSATQTRPTPRARKAAPKAARPSVNQVPRSSISVVPKMKTLRKKDDLSRLGDEVIATLVKNKRPSFTAMWNEVVRVAQNSFRVGMLSVRKVL
jgi:hypothetical protein